MENIVPKKEGDEAKTLFVCVIVFRTFAEHGSFCEGSDEA